jgi:hypothetical protein
MTPKLPSLWISIGAKAIYSSTAKAFGPLFNAIALDVFNNSIYLGSQ